MKKVELVKGVYSSVIGFGCAPVLGSVSAKRAKYAVDCALDCGINHFDLARSYGYGEAEKFVGKLIKDQRNKIVISSKFGIKANWKADLLKPAKPIIRFIKSEIIKHSKDQTEASHSKVTIADRFHNRIAINPGNMRKSLEQSLTALNSDFIDFFFIHEPPEVIYTIDDILSEAEKLKVEGKIRAFGMSLMYDQKKLHNKYINSFDVLQFNKPSIKEEYESLIKERQNNSNVLFSVLRRDASDSSPKQKLLQLHADLPQSVILCSMFSKEHIEENALLFS